MDLELRTEAEPAHSRSESLSNAQGSASWLLWSTGLGAAAATAGALAVAAGRTLGADAFTVAAASFAVVLAVAGAVLVLGLTVRPPFRWRGAPPNTALPLFGVGMIALAQCADVLVAATGDPSGATRYMGSAVVARLVLLVALPGAAWALGSDPSTRPRRLIAAGLFTGALFVLVQAAPAGVVSALFPGRPDLAGGPLRVLALTALLSGGALIGAGILGASGRLPWAWSAGIVGGAGAAAVALFGTAGGRPDTVALAVQIALVSMLAVHALRVRPFRSPEGILILNWRDSGNPEGGGSEVFVEEVASRLAAAGRPVTLFCAGYEGAPREEIRRGIRILRRGSRRTVYVWGFLYHMLGRLGPHRVVVDVQNGVPFLTTLYCHKPVVVLVHHVHREQWGIVFKPRMARFGWWIESRLSPRIYRGARYATVSQFTRAELAGLGVDPASVTVVRNGVVVPDQPEAGKTSFPSICVLGRLVPHKRVELVLRAVAALRPGIPGIEVLVAGSGYWSGRLRASARHLGIGEIVHFLGWVDEETKGRILSASWVLAMPSLKEGWGLAVAEAAARGTPAVGFESAGGLTESILHGRTGLLVSTEDEFHAALRGLLTDGTRRREMGDEARMRAASYRWERAASRFEAVLDAAVDEAKAERRWLTWGSRRRGTAAALTDEPIEPLLERQVP